MDYGITIGLEVHIELNTNTKMFCSCANDSDEKEPNVNVCPICMGNPGALPAANDAAIAKIIALGEATGCAIEEESFFERKSYFYPDLPKGYQITQYQKPFCRNGLLLAVRIERIHLEEDAGRLRHGDDWTLVNFNRAGVPLAELVTYPDIHQPEDVQVFIYALRDLVRSIGVSGGHMEKGHLRVDVNISVSADSTLGTKVEVKNINSAKFARRAAEYEVNRQVTILESGGKVEQETRGWDERSGTTIPQRSKEGGADYRYFPEPDIPPIRTAKYLTNLTKE